MDKLKIYFLGSGPIAVPILRELIFWHRTGQVDLVGIGTQPDRPAGRKQQLLPTPVGAFAAEQGLEIDKFSSINDEDALAKLHALSPDFIVVASYGQLLKQAVLELPKYRCLNVHASLLPLYRGASPIAHAIANGDAETGISFMDMEAGLDTGRVFAVVRMALDGTEYAEPLEEALGELAAKKLLEVLEKRAAGELPGVVQDHKLATLTKKIKKSDGIIDWQSDARKIEAKIRAYTPWPGASFTLILPKEEKRMAITRAQVVPNASNALPGTIVQADRRGWVIACGVDALELLEVLPPGKKAMTAAQFLNGCRDDLVGLRLKTE